MKNSTQIIKLLLRDEAGQDIVEYGLVACLLALGAVASLKTLSTSLGRVFSAVGTTITGAV